MVRLTYALVVTVSGFSTAHAAPAKTSPFSNKSYGDGGGYKHPDAAVGQFFETKPDTPPETKPERPSAPAQVAPEIKPVPATVSRRRPRPFAPAVRPEESPALDSASEDARRDYESRLFGAAPAPQRPRLAAPSPGKEEGALTRLMARSDSGEGMLFVSLELDAQEAGALRDAVAGLGAAAAFRPDARFQPLPGAGGSVRISGWLPASRLGDAIARPGVKRVEVERGFRRSAADSSIMGDYLLKLRVSDSARPEESIAASVSELTSKAGFILDRVLGVDISPAGGATALVSGTMPLSQLARVLGLPGVIRVSSALPVDAAAAAYASPAAAGREPAKKGGFLKFVMARSLWLVLLTVLLALPTVGGAVKKALAVFVPYR